MDSVEVSPFCWMKLTMILPLKLCAAFGSKITWNEALVCSLSLMGSAGPVTINSERVLETPASETVRRLLLFITKVIAALFVFTATEPKLSELGVAPTADWTGWGMTRVPIKMNATDKHTNSVLFMNRQSFVNFSGAKIERDGRGEGA